MAIASGAMAINCPTPHSVKFGTLAEARGEKGAVAAKIATTEMR